MCPTLGAGRRLDNCGNTNCRLIIPTTITWFPKETGFSAGQNPAYRVSAPRPHGGVIFFTKYNPDFYRQRHHRPRHIHAHTSIQTCRQNQISSLLKTLLALLIPTHDVS